MSQSLPVVIITRKDSFSSSHRLHSLELSDEENVRVFGKCNGKNGHGHNYTVEVSIKGPVDSKTGMVMNLTELKDIMTEYIMKPLDHKNIDKDVAYFKTTPSTAENIAVFIWDSLRSNLPKPDLLYEVKLFETDKNFVVFRGKKIASLTRRLSENICANMSSDSE